MASTINNIGLDFVAYFKISLPARVNKMFLPVNIRFAVIFVCLALQLACLQCVVLKDKCVCEDKSLCKAIKVGPRQEVYGFSTQTENWKHWDWEKLTTVCLFGKWDEELLCHAHSKNVRVTLKIDFPVTKLPDEDYRKELIFNATTNAKDLYADGVNIDIEQIVKKGSTEEEALTLFSKELTEAFHKEIPGSQVTFDVAWSPDCIDSRCYDYKGISEVTDFLVVMSYDERGQIFGPCVAGPNAAFGTTFKGISEFMHLGIPPKKLVLGLPWYGYNYPCISYEENVCKIKKVPFRGVNCSDAAGRQYCFSDILSKYLPQAIGGRQFDKESLSPYFHYKDADDGQIHEIWYDDVESLGKKYSHGIKDLGLRGLSFWNIDCLNYTTDPQAEKQTKEMWNAVFVN